MRKLAILLVFAVAILSINANGLSSQEAKMLQEISVENLSGTIDSLVTFSPRLVGSGTMDDNAVGGVLDAAKYIESRLKSFGLETEIETFDIQAYQIYEYSLIIDFDGNPTTPDQLDLTKNSIPFVPNWQWRAATVIDMNMDKKISFLGENSEDKDLQDKIVIASSYQLWKDNDKMRKATDSAPARLVYYEGAPYTVQYNRWNTFSISGADYEKMIKGAGQNTTVHIVYRAEMKPEKGYNVIGKINGRDDHEVILTAHIDTIYSKGAIDNGSGISSLLEVARIMSKYEFKHDVVFAFVDSEEVGGNGSENYVNMHEREIKDAIGAINVDCIASGTPDGMTVGFNHHYPDLMRQWGYFWENQKTDASLDDFLRKVALEIVGYEPQSMYVETISGGSDFGNFSAAGIPATDMGWIDAKEAKTPAISDKKITDEYEMRWETGGKQYYQAFGRFNIVIPFIHTLEDKEENVNMENVTKATQVLLISTARLAEPDDGKEAGMGLSVLLLFFAIMFFNRKP